jgi:hypothetical protein
MRKLCTLITSKSTDIDENIAYQNHATRKPKPGYLKLTIISIYTRRIEPGVACVAGGFSSP